MIIFPGPQGLVSKLCGIDLFKGTRFQLGFLALDEDAEGTEILIFAVVELEAEVEDKFEGPAPLPSSWGSRAAFSD